jgi:hypothetical protein
MFRSACAGSVVAIAIAIVGCASRHASSELDDELAGSGGSSGATSIASGGAPAPQSASGAASTVIGPPGFSETPGSGPFQGSGTGGAPVAGSGGSAPAGAGGQPNEGGAPSGGSAGAAPPKRKLRDTAPGDVVIFDPDEVYAVGYVSDVDQYVGPYGIAPLADTTDAITALSLFGDEHIRRSDGHLLHSYLGSDSNGLGVTTPLYEFRRDEVDLANFTKGESSFDDVVSACAAAPRGTSGQPNQAGDYLLSFDDAVFHWCMQDMWPATSRMVWYSAAEPSFTFASEGLVTVGHDNRTLVWAQNDTYSVVDMRTGTGFASHTVQELFIGVPSGAYALATRAHSDGFWLAGGSADYESVEAMQWVRLDLSGTIVGAGYYAPLPAGVTLDTGNWTRSHPVIDGRGAFYQFAWLGSEPVIVRRPMSGDSDVFYRESVYDISHPHQVMPYYLVTAH